MQAAGVFSVCLCMLCQQLQCAAADQKKGGVAGQVLLLLEWGSASVQLEDACAGILVAIMVVRCLGP